MSTHHLLMIEDDTRLAAMVGEYLTQSGFTVTHMADGESGLAALQDKAVDLVILDLMLPDIDGLEVCRRIRALPGPVARVPVLMLTAKGDPMDRIVGLELGADDYLPKPFEPRELLARIRAVLRRRTDAPAAAPQVLRFGSLEIDRDARIVTVAGDLTQQDAIDRVIAEAGGRIDGLANVAGINDDFSPLHETTDAMWERVMGVNVTGAFTLTSAVLPAMIAAGAGSIVNIATEAGLRRRLVGAVTRGQ